MESPIVLVTDFEFSDLALEKRIFEERGVSVETMQADGPAEIAATDIEPDALLVQYAEITEDVFDALPSLEAVGVYGIGVDNIDVASANRHGVTVVNVPTYCEDEVAEHTLAVLMACERKIPPLNDQVKRGDWDWKESRPMRRLTGLTLGIVGFGKIGRTVVEKTAGLGFTVVVTDPLVSKEDTRDLDVEFMELDELLQRSDVVTVHAPLTEETRGMFDEEAFETMDSDAVFINAARGPIVDVDALADALEAGEIRAAGLDVLPEEPPATAETRLFEFDNVVLTPHCAWYSEQSIEDVRRIVASDLAGILTGNAPVNPVEPESS